MMIFANVTAAPAYDVAVTSLMQRRLMGQSNNEDQCVFVRVGVNRSSGMAASAQAAPIAKGR